MVVPLFLPAIREGSVVRGHIVGSVRRERVEAEEGRVRGNRPGSGLALPPTPASATLNNMLQTVARRSATCSTLSSATIAASALPPVRWTYLPDQVPYHLGLRLQEHLVQSRLSAKAALLSADPSRTSREHESLERVASTDVLLLLQHRPVYTAGKREKDPVQAAKERERLGKLGADYVQTGRGGQTTYHGPGQLVGYPLIDLGVSKVSPSRTPRRR